MMQKLKLYFLGYFLYFPLSFSSSISYGCLWSNQINYLMFFLTVHQSLEYII